MLIYIASSFVSQRRLHPIREKLFAMGFECCSTWLDELRPAPGLSREEFDRQLAIKDMIEVRGCDIFILDTLDESTTGGRYCELGIAMTDRPRLKMHIGPITNIFERLCDKHSDDWDSAFRFLATIAPQDKFVATGMEGKEFTTEEQTISTRDGWLPWDEEGIFPLGIDPGATVHVMLRNGSVLSECEDRRARDLDWSHDGGPHDIVAYRQEV
jgi:hypothetical protein